MWLFGETMPHVPVARPAQTRVIREQPPTGRRVGKPVWYAPAAVIGDVTCAAVPVYLAFALTGGRQAAAYAMVAAAAWLLVRGARDRYGERRLGECDNIGPAVQDWLVLIGLLAVVRAATGEESPFLLALAALVPCAPTSAAVRNLIHRHLVARRRDGRAVRRALVIGEANAVDGLVSHLAKRTDHEFVVVGVCPIGDEDPHTLAPVATRIGRQAPPRPSADSAPVLDAARRLHADVVLVVPGPYMNGTRLRRLSWALHGEECPLVVVPGLTEVAGRRVGVLSVAGLTMLAVAPPLRRGLRRCSSR